MTEFLASEPKFLAQMEGKFHFCTSFRATAVLFLSDSQHLGCKFVSSQALLLAHNHLTLAGGFFFTFGCFITAVDFG